MEKIYRILLGIFLVCLIPILLVLSYWSCRYSYYGTVDYSIRNLLIKDSTILLFSCWHPSSSTKEING